MKKYFAAFLLLSCCFLFLQGCMKDSCEKTYNYTFFQPVYKTKAEVRNNIRSNSPRSIERPGKIYIRAPYIFLSEVDKGIHIIDNTDPAHPVNKAFIDVPGCMDIAVKGNTLYADMYRDMIAIDITNPLQVNISGAVENVFPHRYYYGSFAADSTKIIVDWIKKDTVVKEDCYGNGRWNKNDVFMTYSSGGSIASAAVSPYGVGGSMARFAIVTDRLYTVSDRELNVFNISTPSQPSFVKKTDVGLNIETIYPFKNNLFIGSATGMFVYTVSTPDNPTRTGQFSHVRSCDPVIADDEYAYVTLRSGTTCQGFTNQLEVLKLNNLTNPTLVKTYSLANPHGLAKDGNTLLICDGSSGLKIFDATDISNLQLKTTVAGLETFDVIAMNNVAIVVAKDGLYQYNYSNRSNPTLLSKLTISK